MTWIERTAHPRLPRAVHAERRHGTRAAGTPQLRADLALWLDERPNWPGVGTSPALLLNRRGGQLLVRGASDIIQSIASSAGLGDGITAHVGRHTFATALVRSGTDLVVVADLLATPALDTVRACTRPTEDDRTKALNLLPTDR